MGYRMELEEANRVLKELQKEYEIFAPRLFQGDGCFSETDTVRYGQVRVLEDIVFDKKSDYSFKEALLPIKEPVFYFSREKADEPEPPEKGRILFLRSCDLHAIRRLDQIYLRNGDEDPYYRRLREKTHFFLMGCPSTCKTGFCVSAGTNRAEWYDAYISVEDGQVCVDSKWDWLTRQLEGTASTCDVQPQFVTENQVSVTYPQKLSIASYQLSLWEEYGARCIGCGRCNFVCPTCTCFSMQDVLYRDNGGLGERRRVWSSCQVDGYTDMAGGLSVRKSQGERFRFKVLHKIHDFKERFGYQMCVGCGRCDAVCPEYISFSGCVNRLAKEERE